MWFLLNLKESIFFIPSRHFNLTKAWCIIISNPSQPAFQKIFVKWQGAGNQDPSKAYMHILISSIGGQIQDRLESSSKPALLETN